MTKTSTNRYKDAHAQDRRRDGHRHASRSSATDKHGQRAVDTSQASRSTDPGRRGRTSTRSGPPQTAPYRSRPGPSSPCPPSRRRRLRSSASRDPHEDRRVDRLHAPAPPAALAVDRRSPRSACCVLGRAAPAGAVARRHPTARRRRAPARRSSTRRRSAHADDRIAFTPGGRVTVPFTPRAATAGGRRRRPRGACPPAACRARRCATPRPARRRPEPCRPRRRVGGRPPDRRPGDDHRRRQRRLGRPRRTRPIELAAAVDPGGLRREVFGFLPYWELADSSTTARLGEDLDRRLLRRRRRRQRQPQQTQRRRLDDGRLERLDQLEDDERHRRRPSQRRPRRADRPELRLDLDRR